MEKPYRYYWEDFPVGSTREFAGQKLTQEAMVRFAREFDPQPFHTDAVAAGESIYGGIIASGWHTCALAMRMMCDAYLLETASSGSPGMESIKWLKPVRPGDTLRLLMAVLEARPLGSKPHLGLIRSQWQMFNQNGECVMEMEGYGMVRKRPPC